MIEIMGQIYIKLFATMNIFIKYFINNLLFLKTYRISAGILMSFYIIFRII